jgi:hypothetical protein
MPLAGLVNVTIAELFVVQVYVPPGGEAMLLRVATYCPGVVGLGLIVIGREVIVTEGPDVAEFSMGISKGSLSGDDPAAGEKLLP